MRHQTKIYKLKWGSHIIDNEDGIIYGVNDPLTLELKDFEKYEKSLYPFKRKLPDLKEYNQSNISQDYQLKKKPPDLKEYNESNVSKDCPLENKTHNLEEYNESHLAKENILTHNSELKEPELKESKIKEPKIDAESSSHAMEENINALPDDTVSTAEKGNNAVTEGNNFGISGNIPSDVDQIERTVETVISAFKEDDIGDIEEYIETHEKKQLEVGPKNYGLLDFFSFPLHHLLGRNVYLLEKERSSLYELGKKATKGQLTQELINKYLANCEEEGLKEENVENKHKLKIKEQKRKEREKRKRQKEKKAHFEKRRQEKLLRKKMANTGVNAEGEKAEAKKPEVNKTQVKKTAVKENNEEKKKSQEGTKKTNENSSYFRDANELMMNAHDDLLNGIMQK
ncbi:hypothetical protein C922_00427 [Plasmodium inui San Antonio 1]|uniref:Uncharacterized protein n=1 Tax=Plasmodium inui San Antonio 1 TaxID=1237626 RepID=W7AE59_9APIC|nr:hypothetical protein C922_00427 [Plasmodium inui San Antonio 1]EUD69563.1 hypothetical protein C922_00427 [Plasmodium inui San Antonio 1]